MNVANEAGQQYGVATYDLAVALKAYSIQSLDAPDFDKLLIMLGNFHLELAFYGALGTYINESGAQHLLTESGILAEGSLMGFINGKYYNRCVRIHEILALAMERKMYESFMSTLPKDKQDDIKDLLLTIPEAVNDQEAFLTTSQIFGNRSIRPTVVQPRVLQPQIVQLRSIRPKCQVVQPHIP